MTIERLHKILAQAGVASRRASEAYIRDGRVAVNGETITTMGYQIDPTTVTITVDGRPLESQKRLVYLALYKPRDYVTTTGSDPLGRPTVMDLIQHRDRLYPVGRLDADTEGLLLLTNDGELAHRLMHPRYYIQKEYIAKVQGVPTSETLRQLRGGVPTSHQPEPAPPDRIDLIERLESDASLVRVVIHEGAKHQVRDMLAAVGHRVLSLRRTRVGPIFLGELRRGQSRELTGTEVEQLQRMVRLSGANEPATDRRNAPTPSHATTPLTAHQGASRPARPIGRGAPSPRPNAPRPMPTDRQAGPATPRPTSHNASRPPSGAPGPRPGAMPERRGPGNQSGAPPRGRRGPWWADELDQHPPQVRTWHAPDARHRASGPQPGGRPSARPPDGQPQSEQAPRPETGRWADRQPERTQRSETSQRADRPPVRAQRSETGQWADHPRPMPTNQSAPRFSDRPTREPREHSEDRSLPQPGPGASYPEGTRRPPPGRPSGHNRPSPSPSSHPHTNRRTDRPAGGAFGDRNRPTGNTRHDRPAGGAAGPDRPTGGTWRDRPASGAAGRDRPAGGAWRDQPAGGAAGRDRPAGGAWRDRPAGGPGRERPGGGPGRDRPAGGRPSYDSRSTPTGGSGRPSGGPSAGGRPPGRPIAGGRPVNRPPQRRPGGFNRPGGSPGRPGQPTRQSSRRDRP